MGKQIHILHHFWEGILLFLIACFAFRRIYVSFLNPCTKHQIVCVGVEKTFERIEVAYSQQCYLLHR